MTESIAMGKYIRGADLLLKEGFPEKLITALLKVQHQRKETLYISGGTVRDLLLKRAVGDLDITVKKGAEDCCRDLLNILSEGAFVQLGTEKEEAARVVWRDVQIDFSSFRLGATTIEEELRLRDFTINGMAISLTDTDLEVTLIDPHSGRKDLQHGLLRACDESFENDPLRMLRGFRFTAELGFKLTPQTLQEIVTHHSSVTRCAKERIQYELDRILSVSHCADVLEEMAGCGLLWVLFPELKSGVGVEQPGFHHKDVFNHSLLTLQCVDEVMEDPSRYFKECSRDIEDYLNERARKLLRWSALFHDIGKPSTMAHGKSGSHRVTFYSHDQAGSDIFSTIGRRLRWSNGDLDWVCSMIDMHMHPFHLTGIKRKANLSRKACLKIYRRAGGELPGLFILAMADSLAGRGELKPVDMEDLLAELFDEIWQVSKKYIEPKIGKKRLVTGNDLINIFHLQPGPAFRIILEGLDLAMVEEKVNSREEALNWVEEYIADPKIAD